MNTGCFHLLPAAHSKLATVNYSLRKLFTGFAVAAFIA